MFLTTAVGPAEPSATRDEEFETDRLACPVGANAAMEEENVPVTGNPASVDPLHGCQTLVVVFLQRMMALFVGCARAASWKSKRAASAPATRSERAGCCPPARYGPPCKTVNWTLPVPAVTFSRQ